VGAGPLPTVVGALDRVTLDLPHRERGTAVGAAIGDHGRLATLGQEDGERFTQYHGALRTILQVLDPRDGLPAMAQRQRDLLAGRDSTWALVEHRHSLQTALSSHFIHGCLPR